AVAALRGIAHRQQKALVGARQVLQARIAPGGKGKRLARQVERRRIARRHRLLVDQVVVLQQVGDARHGGGQGLVGRRQRLGGRALFFQREIQQPLRVVVGGAEYLAARHILESGRNTARQAHARRVDRLRIAETRQ